MFNFFARRRSAGRPSLAFAGLASAGMCISTGAGAVDVGDRLVIHGYGHTSYFNTDGEESWDDGLVSLLFIGTLTDRSNVWIQLHNTTEVSHLDWAFVDYRVNADLTVRGGQMKLPIGLYNEIIDSRFLHQSILPPLLYQEGAGFTDENFRGANATYSLGLGAGSLAVTGYFGEVARGDDTPETTIFRRLYGVNAIYVTPVEGLRFVYSGYRSRLEEMDTNLASSGDGAKIGHVLSLDYVNNGWDLKSEYGRLKFRDQRGKTAYGQLGLTFAEHWLPFVRYDYLKFDMGGTSTQNTQKTLSVGVSYLLNDSVSLRAEGHRNRGLAIPYFEWLSSNPEGALDPDAAPTDDSWNSWGLSVSFIF